MLKGYLLEKYSNMGDAITPARFLEEAKKQGIDLRIVGIADCHVSGDDGGHVIWKGIDLKADAPDLVINRYKFGEIKDQINSYADHTFNNISSFNKYLSKGVQMAEFSFLWKGENAILSYPKTLMIHRLSDFSKNVEMIRDQLGFPVVAKGLLGSCGAEVTLISDEVTLRNYLKSWQENGTAYAEEERLFQKFLSGTEGSDVRSLCVQGEVLASMIRKGPSGDFRSNVALGGTVKETSVLPVIRETAQKIYEHTGLFCFGLDLLPDGKDFAFCEINVMPGLSGIEEATGKNLTGEILYRFRQECLHK